MAFQLGFAIAVSAFFVLLLWLMIFLQTYQHFPKMEKRKRLLMSIGNATALSLSVAILAIASLWLLLEFILKKAW